MKSHKNIERILKRKSFKGFIEAMDYHVDIKEWSEVGGVYDIARKILHHFEPEIIMDVGCGKRPTLATIMALNYKIKVVAIDPNLDIGYSKNIERLDLHKETLLSHSKRTDLGKTVLVLANHSHASKHEISLLLSKTKDWVYVTIPCCMDNKLHNKTSIHYKDIHMHSEKNDVFIFSKDGAILSKILENKGKVEENT